MNIDGPSTDGLSIELADNPLTQRRQHVRTCGWTERPEGEGVERGVSKSGYKKQFAVVGQVTGWTLLAGTSRLRAVGGALNGVPDPQCYAPGEQQSLGLHSGADSSIAARWVLREGDCGVCQKTPIAFSLMVSGPPPPAIHV